LGTIIASRIFTKNYWGSAPNPAVIFIGSSLGAMVCQMAAVTQGSLAMVLIDGFIPLKRQLPSKPLFLMSLPFIGKKWYRAFRNDHEGAWRSLFPFYADMEKLPEADRAFLRQRVIDRVCSAKQEAAYFKSLRSMIFLDWRESNNSVIRLRADGLPKTALIWGAEDNIIPLAAAKEYAEQTGTKLQVIEGAGHLPHQERAEEVAAGILAIALSSP
jgi:pimeloyl-ACP methyl ester carboxylesterase